MYVGSVVQPKFLKSENLHFSNYYKIVCLITGGTLFLSVDVIAMFYLVVQMQGNAKACPTYLVLRTVSLCQFHRLWLS